MPEYFSSILVILNIFHHKFIEVNTCIYILKISTILIIFMRIFLELYSLNISNIFNEKYMHRKFSDVCTFEIISIFFEEAFFYLYFEFLFICVCCRTRTLGGVVLTATSAAGSAVHKVIITNFCPPFQHLLSERLTSLGIMGAPRMPPLNPSETIVF